MEPEPRIDDHEYEFFANISNGLTSVPGMLCGHQPSKILQDHRESTLGRCSVAPLQHPDKVYGNLYVLWATFYGPSAANVPRQMGAQLNGQFPLHNGRSGMRV